MIALLYPSADLYDGTTGANEGRFYIFRSDDTPDTQMRTISLNLRRHLVAKGKVSAKPAPVEQGCISDVPVIIKRNGRKIAQKMTNDSGGYRVRLPDKQGRYRAVATKTTSNDLECLRAVSDTRRHKH